MAKHRYSAAAAEKTTRLEIKNPSELVVEAHVRLADDTIVHVRRTKRPPAIHDYYPGRDILHRCIIEAVWVVGQSVTDIVQHPQGLVAKDDGLAAGTTWAVALHDSRRALRQQ